MYKQIRIFLRNLAGITNNMQERKWHSTIWLEAQESDTNSPDLAILDHSWDLVASYHAASGPRF